MCGCQPEKGIVCDFHAEKNVWWESQPAFLPSWIRYTRLDRFFHMTEYAREILSEKRNG